MNCSVESEKEGLRESSEETVNTATQMRISEELERFRRQYFQCMDPRQLAIPPLDVLRKPATQETIYTSMFSNDIAFLPPEKYRFSVLKRLLDVLQGAFRPEEDVRLSLHVFPGLHHLSLINFSFIAHQ